jgi:hypothetical protein
MSKPSFDIKTFVDSSGAAILEGSVDAVDGLTTDAAVRFLARWVTVPFAKIELSDQAAVESTWQSALTKLDIVDANARALLYVGRTEVLPWSLIRVERPVAMPFALAVIRGEADLVLLRTDGQVLVAISSEENGFWMFAARRTNQGLQAIDPFTGEGLVFDDSKPSSSADEEIDEPPSYMKALLEGSGAAVLEGFVDSVNGLYPEEATSFLGVRGTPAFAQIKLSDHAALESTWAEALAKLGVLDADGRALLLVGDDDDHSWSLVKVHRPSAMPFGLARTKGEPHLVLASMDGRELLSISTESDTFRMYAARRTNGELRAIDPFTGVELKFHQEVRDASHRGRDS